MDIETYKSLLDDYNVNKCKERCYYIGRKIGILPSQYQDVKEFVEKLSSKFSFLDSNELDFLEEIIEAIKEENFPIIYILLKNRYVKNDHLIFYIIILCSFMLTESEDEESSGEPQDFHNLMLLFDSTEEMSSYEESEADEEDTFEILPPPSTFSSPLSPSPSSTLSFPLSPSSPSSPPLSPSSPSSSPSSPPLSTL